MQFPEIGYTPENLKALRHAFNLTQQQVADLTETKSWRTVSKWESNIFDLSHADMPLKKWVKLYNHTCNMT